MSHISTPNPDHNNNHCLHNYKITRVVMDHPDGGVVVFGDDNEFHVVDKKCVPSTTKREISIRTA